MKLIEFYESEDWRLPFYLGNDTVNVYTVDPNKSYKPKPNQENIYHSIIHWGVGILPIGQCDEQVAYELWMDEMIEVEYRDENAEVHPIYFSPDEFEMNLSDSTVLLPDLFTELYLHDEDSCAAPVFIMDKDAIEPLVLLGVDNTYAYYLSCKCIDKFTDDPDKILQTSLQPQILFMRNNVEVFYLGQVSLIGKTIEYGG